MDSNKKMNKMSKKGIYSWMIVYESRMRRVHEQNAQTSSTENLFVLPPFVYASVMTCFPLEDAPASEKSKKAMNGQCSYT